MNASSPRTRIGRTLIGSTMARRGMTAHLPVYFAISLIVAAVLDVVAATVSFVAQPDDNYGAALTIVSVFIRPGMLTLLLIAVLVFAFLRGRDADARASSEPRTTRRSRKTPAAVIAGWIAVAEGALLTVGVVMLTLGLAEASARYEGPDAAWLGPVILGFAALGVVITGVLVWLGILVLRNRLWARYALVAYCALAGLGVLVWPLLKREPLVGWGLAAIAVLLIWAELRERGRAGSFRNSWRGILLLVLNAHVIVIYVVTEVGTGDPDDAFALALFAFTLTGYFLIALLLAMWATNRDTNDLWAGLNASIVVLAPSVISLVGFIATAVEVLGHATAG